MSNYTKLHMTQEQLYNAHGIHTTLRELCAEILADNVRSLHFTQLLLKSGVIPDSVEWEMANRLLGRGEEVTHNAVLCGHTVQ